MTLLRATAVAALLIIPAIAQAASVPPALVTAYAGANTYALPTAQGRVVVYLPDDIRPGDTISGQVLAEPAGDTAAQRQVNSDTLNGEVIDIAGTRTRVANGRLRFVLAPAAAAGLRLTLRSAGGQALAASGLIDTMPRQAGGRPTPGQVVLPRLGQAGRPIQILGPFDGDAANTNVSIGGVPAAVLAESPRQATLAAPLSAGPTPVSVTENGRTTTGAFRNLKIDLSAPKTSLLKGESTTLTIQVSGLEGITQPQQISLVGSANISLSGGSSQVVNISPGDLDPGGAFHTTRQVGARVAGPFEITARLALAAPARDPLHPDAVAMNGIDSSKALLAALAGMSEDEQAALLRATLRALNARLADARDDRTREWLRGKIAIVEDALVSLGYSR